MSENNRNPIEKCRKKLSQFTTMNVIDGQASLVIYASLIFYSLTIDNILNIIVLLILAGVSIATLIGDNGIVTQATEAKVKNEEASREEVVKLEVMSSFNRSGKYDAALAKQNLEENLGAIVEENYSNNTLKVIYKGEEFLVDQNSNVLKIEIPKNLKIGDEVSYNPKEKEYIWKAKYSGKGTDVKLNNNAKEYSITKWKVLNINGNGTIDLIAESPTIGTVPLGYAQGYNNGVKLLNDAYISENSKFPSIYANENLSTINGNKNENGLERYEQEDFIEEDYNQGTNGAITNVQSIQPYQTYWYRDHKFVETMFKNVENEPSIKYYDLLMPKRYETKYWLASRAIHVNEVKSQFGIRMVFWWNE
ncbi:MAG: hypothetical protein ACLTBX_07965 [Clostridia bacterium]